MPNLVINKHLLFSNIKDMYFFKLKEHIQKNNIRVLYAELFFIKSANEIMIAIILFDLFFNLFNFHSLNYIKSFNFLTDL